VSRAHVFIQMCEKQRAKPREFRDPDDHYYRAVVLSNRGEHGAAIQHLEQALQMVRRKRNALGKAREDVIRYLLAVSYGLRGEAEPALTHLEEAIRLNERNRVLARNSPDFLPLREAPRFRALVGADGDAPAG